MRWGALSSSTRENFYPERVSERFKEKNATLSNQIIAKKFLMKKINDTEPKVIPAIPQEISFIVPQEKGPQNAKAGKNSDENMSEMTVSTNATLIKSSKYKKE